MVSQALFSLLVLVVVMQRLWEVRKSRRHERALRERGAHEAAERQMPVMKVMHGAWFVSMLLEVWLADRLFFLPLAVVALLVFALGQSLRMLAMRALGERWTVNVMVLPQTPPVASGIFRYLRHPNYLGVILEIAALPLVHGAWMTSVVFSVANGCVLYFRVREEEAALESVSDYRGVLGSRPRFFPSTEVKA